jgi:hypothetical protein
MDVSGRSDLTNGRCRQLERDHVQLSGVIAAKKKFASSNVFSARSRSELARRTSCQKSVTINKSGIKELRWS